MLSSLNHHVAILHLRVHRRYLDILTTGGTSEVPVPDASVHDDCHHHHQPWHVLKLERTRWFDLFVAEDRVEALKGLWRVFHYMMRAGTDGGS